MNESNTPLSAEQLAAIESEARSGHPKRSASFIPADVVVALVEMARSVALSETKRSFSDFIRNATPEEKEAVYSEVMAKATERQNAVASSAGGECKEADRMEWIADKIPAYGDYAKEAAIYLMQYAHELRTRSATGAFLPNPSTLWVVWFEDKDHPPEVFFGEGAESAARLRYKQAYDNWSCHLLVRVPTRHHGNSVSPDAANLRVSDRTAAKN